MRNAWLLFRLSFKRLLPLLLASGLVLASFQLFRVFLASSVHRTSGFEQIAEVLPPFVRAILGPALASVMSFSGIVCGGYFDLAIVLGLLGLVIALSTLPASEIETGFADLVLARPMRRHWLISRTILLVVLSVILMLFMIRAGTWAGQAIFAPPGAVPPTRSQLNNLAINLGMLMLCWSGIAMALGSGLRRGTAGATTALLAFAMLILDYAQQLWQPLERVGWVSPFRYFRPFELVMGDPLPVDHLLVLWAIGMTGFVLSYLILSQRDISR